MATSQQGYSKVTLEVLEHAFLLAQSAVQSCVNEVTSAFGITRAILQSNSTACLLEMEKVSLEICRKLPVAKYSRSFITYKDIKLTRSEVLIILDTVFKKVKFTSVQDLRLYRSMLETHILEYGELIPKIFKLVGKISKDEFLTASRIFDFEAKIIKNRVDMSVQITDFESKPIIQNLMKIKKSPEIIVWKSSLSSYDINFIRTSKDMVTYYNNKFDTEDQLPEHDSSVDSLEDELEYQKEYYDVEYNLEKLRTPMIEGLKELCLVANSFFARITEIFEIHLKHLYPTLENNFKNITDKIKSTSDFASIFSKDINGYPEMLSLISKISECGIDKDSFLECFEARKLTNSYNQVLLPKLFSIRESLLEKIDDVIFENIKRFEKYVMSKGLSEFKYPEYSLEIIEYMQRKFCAKEGIAGMMFEVKLNLSQISDMVNCYVQDLTKITIEHLWELEREVNLLTREVEENTKEFYNCFKKVIIDN